MIGSYYDVYNTKAYAKRVSDIDSSINSLLNGNFYTDAINEVNRQIEVLEKKEEAIFRLLKVNSIEELNARLEEYKGAVFNLSGAGLNQAFIAVLNEKNKQEFDAFNDAVLEVINEDIFKGKTIQELGEKVGRELILNFLNTGVGKNVHFSSYSGMTKQGIFPASFTEQQTKRWKKLLEKKFSNKPSVQKYLKVVGSSDGDNMSAQFTWQGISENLTPTEAKERLSESEVNEINRKIKGLILSKVGSDQSLVSRIIDHVLSKDNYAFFVGKNINDITGLLGEIQGVYYLSKLLGGDMATALQWQGGLHNVTSDKTKPHRDILLDMFGIQVKNTTKEEIGRVNFVTNNIGTLLDKIGLSQDTRNIFENFYGTLNFNVEYHVDLKKPSGARYQPGLDEDEPNAPVFALNKQHLLSLQDDIDKLLSLFSSTFMYMDIAEQGQQLDANSLYLLGGTAFQTASQILHNILDDLKGSENKRFKVNLSSKNGRDIISALNQGTRNSDYSSSVINDIKLTSSYLF